MQGTVPETVSRSEMLQRLEKFWKHDIYYVSKLIKSKVLVVTVLNDLSYFNTDQVRRFAEDLRMARESGIIVLLFGHEPSRTNNPEDRSVTVENILLKGDTSGFPLNLCDYGKNDENTVAFYTLIAENADIIKGVFSGHMHNSMFHKILGRGSNGSDTIIPHYIITTNVCHMGHVMRIIID